MRRFRRELALEGGWKVQNQPSVQSNSLQSEKRWTVKRVIVRLLIVFAVLTALNAAFVSYFAVRAGDVRVLAGFLHIELGPVGWFIFQRTYHWTVPYRWAIFVGLLPPLILVGLAITFPRSALARLGAYLGICYWFVNGVWTAASVSLMQGISC